MSVVRTRVPRRVLRRTVRRLVHFGGAADDGHHHGVAMRSGRVLLELAG